MAGTNVCFTNVKTATLATFDFRKLLDFKFENSVEQHFLETCSCVVRAHFLASPLHFFTSQLMAVSTTFSPQMCLEMLIPFEKSNTRAAKQMDKIFWNTFITMQI